MRVFIKVSDVGSFSGVAKLLNVSTPHVSRCVSDLEASVQARLIQRNTRHQSLTEAGARYLESCREIVAKVDEAALEANKSCLTPQGCLKILSDIEFGIEHLAEMMAAYTKDHPDVDLELTLTSGTSNLIDEQQDMQIVVCKLGGFSSVICAAPDYLRRFEKPRSLQDLSKHRILGFNNDRKKELADYNNVRGF
ncbi:LysR family transcriptional regulator, partial [Pseudomonas putida]|nr:LysR family transcriptional regulator [Pseudomonas putida]